MSLVRKNIGGNIMSKGWYPVIDYDKLAIIVGFGILLNMDDVFDNPGEKQTALEEKYEK